MKGLIDSTLREGMQKAGVYLDEAGRSEILRRLMDFGVEEIEIGRADEPAARIAARLALGRRLGKVRLGLWARCRPEDVRAAGRLGPDVLSLSLPASDLLIREKLRSSRAGVLTMLDECAGLARDSGIPVLSLGLEDATRAAPDFLETVMRAAAQAGFGRLRLADTLGVAAPWEMAALVRRAKAMSGIEIGVHTHNDFGMASANAVAAIEAGADWADVSVLGLGERAGCARLEEVAGWLALARGWPGYRLEGLRPLSAAVARLAGLEVAGSHPLVGRDIFACETGLHLVGLFRNPATYEPFEPSLVGGERRLLLGGKAGRGAVRAYFGKRGRDLGGEGLNRLTSAIRAQAEKLRRPLRAGELEGLAKGVNG